MTWVRTVASAVLILVGASLIALWAVSGVTVDAVEDGTAVRGMAERALEDPAVVAALADTLADDAIAALAERGVAARPGLEDALRGLIAGAVSTDAFRGAVLSQVDDARHQFAAQLTDALRDPAPLILEVDSSDYVNAQVDSIPVAGAAIPDLAVPPVPLEVLDAATFEKVRTVYSVMRTAQTWALWAGIALIVIGMFITRRLRWFLAKTGLAIGAITGGLWLVLQRWGVDGVVRVLPGGEDGGLGSMLTRILTQEAVPGLQQRLLAVAIWALVGALVFFLVGVLTMPRRDAARVGRG